MSQYNPENYNSLPYPSLPYAKAHPDRMHTMAFMLGMNPKPVACCSVIELGCASGGNLIPMAYTLPESRFYGIDFSPRQIEAGQAVIAELGLQNITLEAQDILDFEPQSSAVDYIVAHGVYSWVPEDVRNKVLDICQHSLAEEGVAFISYNTQPGWAMDGVMRELIRFNTRGIESSAETIEAAREIVGFMADSLSEDVGPYGAFIKSYNKGRMNESLFSKQFPAGESFLHDDLEAINRPVYFHEFISHASRHGLQYLCEAEDSTYTRSRVSPEVAAQVQQFARGQLEVEQYLDFLTNRRHRQSFLCRQGVALNRKVKPELVERFMLAAPIKAESENPDLAGPSLEAFTRNSTEAYSTDHPLTKAALFVLGKRWPEWLTFEGLLEAARAVLAEQTEAPCQTGDRQLLAANLLGAHMGSSKLLEFHSMEPRFTVRPGVKPVASALARLQARQGQEVVTNLKHQGVTIDNVTRQMLLHLDGSRDMNDIVEVLVSAIQKGDLSLTRNDQNAAVGDEARRFLEHTVFQKLGQLAYFALLLRT